MTIADRVMDVRQVVTAFGSSTCLYLAGFCMCIGLGAGAYAMRNWDRGEIASSDAKLIKFREEMAFGRAETLAQINTLQLDNQRMLRERDESLTELMNGLPGAIAQRVAPEFSRLRGLINAPQYDCLRQPLPDEYLRMLERTGQADTGSSTHP